MRYWIEIFEIYKTRKNYNGLNYHLSRIWQTRLE